MREPRNPARAWRPRGERAAGRAGSLDRTGHDGEAFRVQGEGLSLPRWVRGAVHGGDVREHRRLDARQHVDDRTGRLAAELAEPGAVLRDEVDCEAVRARRHRRAHRDVKLQALSRADLSPERRTHAVPDDRVPMLVEPVVRDGDVITPRRRARVLDPDCRLAKRAGTRRVERPREPACDERPRHRASLGLKTPAADNDRGQSQGQSQ